MSNSDKKQTQQRLMVIKNFKNIGVSKLDQTSYELSDKPEELLISANYTDDKAGGLVVIIGENNTGKSNAVKGVSKFSFNNDEPFNENDYPNFSNYDACEPHLELILRDYTNAGGGGSKYVSNTLAAITQKDGEITYSFCNESEALRAAIGIFTKKLLLDKEFDFNRAEISNLSKRAKEVKNDKELLSIYSKIKNMEINRVAIFKAKRQYKQDTERAHNKLLQSAAKLIEQFESKISNRYLNENIWARIKQQIEVAKNYKAIRLAYEAMQEFIEEAHAKYKNNSWDYSSIIFDFIEADEIQEQVNFTPKNYEDINEVLEEVFEEIEIQIDNKKHLFLPQILNYSDIKDVFKNEDLIVSLDGLADSRFFRALFIAINQPMNSVLNAYEKAKTTPAFLENQERVINKRIKDIVTKKFNEIFGKDNNDGYVFQIRLEEHRISFSIYKNNDDTEREVLIIEQQSNGFKWFFNIYFNLLNGKILKSGDMVLMDEPAHNLSPKARKECAEFLRKYGEENGITFLIVTHDLFWIDSDYLNEVRIIKNREDKELKGVSIQNDFSRIESSDTDTFLEIKRAFGVDTHVFYPPSVRTIFVEGITDYNYLTTFKLLKEKESGERLNIVFLPIGGLGKEGEKEIVLEKLMAQCKEPILLVDADRAADELLKIKEEKKYEKLEIIKLSDIDSRFEEIENLFSRNDMEKYGLETKSGSISSSFKKHILWNKEVEDKDKLEQSTKANFYKVLEHLDKNL